VLFWGGLGAVWLLRGMLHSLRGFFLILLVSLFLSFAIEPAVNRLERTGMRRGLGTGLVFLLVVLSLGGFGVAMGSVLGSQLNDFVDEAPQLIDNLEGWTQRNISTDIHFDDIRDEFVAGGSASRWASNLATKTLSLGTTVINLLLQIFTVGLFTFYLVAEGPRLRRGVCSLLPAARQREVLRIWDLAIEKTGGYIASRAIIGLMSAVAHTIALAIIGVPFPVPLGLWVGFFSQFIPVIGTYIAGALPIVIALVDDPKRGLATIIFVVVYQQIENYVFLPRITAQTMEIHVAVAFGSVIVGAALLGPVGALLSLPAAATLQAFVSSYVQRQEIDESAFAESVARRQRKRKQRRRN
jgi:predicted PurR-regulated permease PerM